MESNYKDKEIELQKYKYEIELRFKNFLHHFEGNAELHPDELENSIKQLSAKLKELGDKSIQIFRECQ